MRKIISLVLALTMAFGVTFAATGAYAAEKKDYPKVEFTLNKKKFVLTDSENYYKSPKKIKYKVKSGKVKSAEYKSSNKKVADVDSKGNIWISGLGETTVTVTLNKNYSKKCKVVVNETYYAVLKGKTYKNPKVNGKKTKSWKSKNSSVVKTGKARLKGVKDGKETVIYKTVKGRKYKVHVYSVAKKTLVNKMKKECPEFVKYEYKVFDYSCYSDELYYITLLLSISPHRVTVTDGDGTYETEGVYCTWAYNKDGLHYCGRSSGK